MKTRGVVLFASIGEFGGFGGSGGSGGNWGSAPNSSILHRQTEKCGWCVE